MWIDTGLTYESIQVFVYRVWYHLRILSMCWCIGKSWHPNVKAMSMVLTKQASKSRWSWYLNPNQQILAPQRDATLKFRHPGHRLPSGYIKPIRWIQSFQILQSLPSNTNLPSCILVFKHNAAWNNLHWVFGYDLFDFIECFTAPLSGCGYVRVMLVEKQTKKPGIQHLATWPRKACLFGRMRDRRRSVAPL